MAQCHQHSSFNHWTYDKREEIKKVFSTSPQPAPPPSMQASVDTNEMPPAGQGSSQFKEKASALWTEKSIKLFFHSLKMKPKVDVQQAFISTATFFWNRAALD